MPATVQVHRSIPGSVPFLVFSEARLVSVLFDVLYIVFLSYSLQTIHAFQVYDTKWTGTSGRVTASKS